MNKAHSPINWENYPKETTPINEENLNKMDRALGIIDDRVIEHEYNKLSKTDASSDIVNVEYDKDTSVFKFAKRNGDVVKADVSSVVVREGYTKEESDQKYANAIKRTYSGETIVATDSAEAKFEGLKVFGRSEQVSTTGKNLASDAFSEYSQNDTYSYKLINESKNNVTVTLTVKDATVDLAGCGIGLFDSQSESLGYQWISYNDKIEIVQETLNFKYLFIFPNTEAAFNKIFAKYDIQIELGSEATSYEPYSGGFTSPSPDWVQPIESVGDDGQIKHEVYGGNLASNVLSEYSKNSSYLYKLINKNRSPVTVSVTVRDDSVDLSGCGIGLFENPDVSGEYKWISYNNKLENPSITLNLQYLFIFPNTEATLNKIFAKYNIQINFGTEALPFEPYRPKQSLFTTVPNGLPGIPLGATIPDAIVSSEALMSGVYFDEEEQQYYIGDTVEHGRGKYVQRIKTLVFDGVTNKMRSADANYSERYGMNYAWVPVANKLIGGAYMATVGKTPSSNLIGIEGWASSPTNDSMSLTLSDERTGVAVGDNKTTIADKFNVWLQANPVTISYVLAVPIETDLSAEEIEAFKALHSNYPTTTILNDDNAYMEAVLVADTKNHIEQNYVPKSEFLSVVDRVSALEQRALA